LGDPARAAHGAGVADVNSLGGLAESFEVVPDNQALAAAGLTVSDLSRRSTRPTATMAPGVLWPVRKR
jgi:Cu/Ag efflux pump CusA